MDVLAVRPDQLDGEEPARRRARIGPALLVLPFVLLVALVAALVWFALRASDHNARNEVRDAVLSAARTEALNLTSISYTTADRDLGRIVAGATGQLRQQFDAQRSQFRVLARDKSVSRGSVLSTALAHLDRTNGSARVLVAADASVSTAAGSGAPPAATLKHYRMVMTLRRVNGAWLVSDVAFAGLPQ